MDPMKLHRELMARLRDSWRGLADKPDETPESTLEALWCLAGLPLRDGSVAALDEPSVLRLRALVDRRLAGEPLAYLIGRQTFMGIEFLSSPEAMIPRKESEILGYAALEVLKTLVAEKGAARVLDLCSGSGNMGLALATCVPACRIFGGDISEEAVRLAERNAQFLGLADRASYRTGDFLASFETEEFLGAVDLLTCNPPYISTARVETMAHEIVDFEPRAAFDGGPLGIKLLARLVKEAPRFVRPGGWVACETGLGQGESMSRMFQKSPDYQQVRNFNDTEGHVRAIVAQVRVH